jgi:hypothetical protein
MQGLADNEIVAKIRAFCEKNRISTSHILAITIQRNFTTEFSSLIIDLDKAELLQHYPTEITSYEEKLIGQFIICFKSELTMPTAPARAKDIPEDSECFPFCCSLVAEYRPRRLEVERIFTDFFAGTGHQSTIVYEVKKQVDSGPLIWTKYFRLLNGRREEVTGKFMNKKHAFKNYKCLKHGLFFAVDLYLSQDIPGANSHHMRVNTFTKVNQEVLSSFFQQMNL